MSHKIPDCLAISDCAAPLNNLKVMMVIRLLIWLRILWIQGDNKEDTRIQCCGSCDKQKCRRPNWKILPNCVIQNTLLQVMGYNLLHMFLKVLV